MQLTVVITAFIKNSLVQVFSLGDKRVRIMKLACCLTIPCPTSQRVNNVTTSVKRFVNDYVWDIFDVVPSLDMVQ